MVINLYNHDTGEQLYEFPRVYFGISNDIAYIYAVQNDRKRFISDKYLKKIERLLYKVNDGLDVKEDTYDNYVKNHPTKSHFLQSHAWGEFAKVKKGLTPYYLGLVNENDEISSTLIITLFS